MAEVNEAKLDKLVKSGKSQPEAARELGLSTGQLNMLTFGKSLVRTGKLDKAPATEASAKKLRASGLRYEYISAATGLSVAKVKEFTAGVDGPAKGRKPGNGSAPKTTSTKAAPAKKAAAGKSAPKGTPARAKTRAQRAAKSGSPS